MKRRELVGAVVTTAAAGQLLPGLARAETAEVPHRQLGRTGESVSILGLGGFHIGHQKDPDESIRIIRTAVDRGITFLDNSWDYNHGASEVRMGMALRDGCRNRVFLMTKFDGRTRLSAARQIDDSLKRLQTDRIDLLQVHEIIRPTDPTRIFGPDGAMEAALAARQAGKVRFLGFTGHKSPEIHLAMLRACEEHGFVPETVQMPLNVLDASYDSFQALVLPELLKRDIGVLGMKPLGDSFVLKSGAVTAEEGLRYAMSVPGVSVTMTGIDSMPILDQALRIARGFQPLSEQDRHELEKKAARVASKGQFEAYKSSHRFDSTHQHPEWLG
jgi:aryl-alcohol dehydrogenase-like predicted oxidoreductase